MLFLSIPYIGTERIVFLNCSQKNLKIFRKHSHRLHLYFADFYLPAKMMMFCLLLFLQHQYLIRKKRATISNGFRFFPLVQYRPFLLLPQKNILKTCDFNASSIYPITVSSSGRKICSESYGSATTTFLRQSMNAVRLT